MEGLFMETRMSLFSSSGNVPHYPGNHCASTGIRNIVNFQGAAWTSLATSLKAVSDDDQPNFSEVEEKLDILIKRESSYHQTALNLG